MALYRKAFQLLVKPWTLSDFAIVNKIETYNLIFLNLVYCVYRNRGLQKYNKNVHRKFLNVRTAI